MPDGFTGRIPATGAPLNARTLALRPHPQSLAPGQDNRTSSDMLADAVYGFLQRHPGLGVPEEGPAQPGGVRAWREPVDAVGLGRRRSQLR